MRCPCLEHGGCPIEHLEQRVAALEASMDLVTSLQAILGSRQPWKLDAGGPEPAAGGGSRVAEVTCAAQTTEQQRDSRAAPTYQDDYPPKQWDSEHMQPAPEQAAAPQPRSCTYCHTHEPWMDKEPPGGVLVCAQCDQGDPESEEYVNNLKMRLARLPEQPRSREGVE